MSNYKLCSLKVGIDSAKLNLETAINNGLQIDMSRFVGYSAKFKAVPDTLVDQTILDYNTEYQSKTVIDGHSDGAFAGAALGSIAVGAVLGIVIVSSVFQIAICGVQVPRIGS